MALDNNIAVCFYGGEERGAVFAATADGRRAFIDKTLDKSVVEGIR